LAGRVSQHPTERLVESGVKGGKCLPVAALHCRFRRCDRQESRLPPNWHGAC
jgi:hypothetical protein